MTQTIAIALLATVFLSLPRGSEASEIAQTQVRSEDEQTIKSIVL